MSIELYYINCIIGMLTFKTILHLILLVLRGIIIQHRVLYLAVSGDIMINKSFMIIVWLPINRVDKPQILMNITVSFDYENGN